MIFNGPRLRQLREAKCWSRVSFARRLNISDPQVGRWEAGKASPRWETVRKICKVFGVSVSELAVEEVETKEEEVSA